MISDRVIVEFDKALRTVFAPAVSIRPMPGAGVDEAPLSDEDRRHAASLMRVNHCGEVCAQALYQGQALTCRDPGIRQELEFASVEETEHLAWTEQRISELQGRKSVLNPLWYAGSLTLGVVAGALGDRWSLGFLEETERQVGAHLRRHLESLPEEDARSRAVVQQMKADEEHHADTARDLGASTLPLPVKAAMRAASKVMTTLAYRF